MAVLPPSLVTTAPALRNRIGQLADRIVTEIQREIPVYHDQTYVSATELREAALRNMEYLLRTDALPQGADLAAARRIGELRAHRGAPLPDLLLAFRIGFTVFWDALSGEVIGARAADDREFAALAGYVFRKADEYTAALAAAYRDSAVERLRRREHERAALFDAVVSGAVTGDTPGEIAVRLGLPENGELVAVVAEVPGVGEPALPGVEDRLRAAGIVSTWRLAPDVETGLVALPRDGNSELVRLLATRATGRVGVSPPFGSLDETPRALYLARVALRGVPAGTVGVRPFDDTPLAALVAASPDAAGRLVAQVLGRLLDLRHDERGPLLETARSWVDAGGSAAEVARRLFVHPNTVRHRLRRLTLHTGRDLETPTGQAELAVALIALELFPDLRPPGPVS